MVKNGKTNATRFTGAVFHNQFVQEATTLSALIPEHCPKSLCTMTSLTTSEEETLLDIIFKFSAYDGKWAERWTGYVIEFSNSSMPGYEYETNLISIGVNHKKLKNLVVKMNGTTRGTRYKELSLVAEYLQAPQ